MSKTSRQAIAPSAKTIIDFKVDPATGVGYISQRKAAELCGLSLTTLHRFVKKSGTPSELNENNQLSDVLFIKVAKFAFSRNTPEAEIIVDTLLQAGARAFIYYQAGVQVPVPVKTNKLHEPCIPVRWLAQQLKRPRSSVDRTLNLSIKRLKGYTVAHEVQFVNGERCVSPALILCSMFTGKLMQAARGWLLQLAEADALPTPEVLLQLSPLPLPIPT